MRRAASTLLFFYFSPSYTQPKPNNFNSLFDVSFNGKLRRKTIVEYLRFSELFLIRWRFFLCICVRWFFFCISCTSAMKLYFYERNRSNCVSGITHFAPEKWEHFITNTIVFGKMLPMPFFSFFLLPFLSGFSQLYERFLMARFPLDTKIFVTDTIIDKLQKNFLFFCLSFFFSLIAHSTRHCTKMLHLYDPLFSDVNRAKATGWW